MSINAIIGVIMYCTQAVTPTAEHCVVLDMWPNTYTDVTACRRDVRTIAQAMAGNRRIMFADCGVAAVKAAPSPRRYDER